MVDDSTVLGRVRAAAAKRILYLAIITAYLPDPEHWSADFRERKTRR